METGTLAPKAAALLALHQGPRILLLPNAWDAGSARMLAQSGVSAVATTSSGIANSLGYPDGEHISRDEMLVVVARIASAVNLPVTADMEAGYGPAPADAAVTAAGAMAAGAVGLNLEDGTRDPGRPLEEIPLMVGKIRAIRDAARAAGVALVINARTDVYLAEVGAPGERLRMSIERGRAFRAAGADCVFVPRMREPAEISEFLRQSPGPLNLLAGPGLPPASELERLGVARLSFGGALYRAVLGLVRRVAEEIRSTGASTSLEDLAVPSPQANRLFDRTGRP